MITAIGIVSFLVAVAFGYWFGHKDGYECGRRSQYTPSRN